MAVQVCKDSTYEDAMATQAAALVFWEIAHYHEQYKTQTTAWDIPKERLDGAWTTQLCPGHDYSGKTLVDYDAGDYPAVEEI